MRVLRDKAFAAAALDADLERNVQLDARDRALATELAYGTLRLLGWLTKRLDRHATRGIGSVDVQVRAQLLVAAYQVLVLTRVPAFAAVDEAVNVVKALRGPRVAGFANAVLRKLAAEPKPGAEEIARAALAAADPELARAIVSAVGEAGALRLLASEESPPLGLRVEKADERETWMARIREARPEASITAGHVSPLAIVARGAGRLTDLPGWEDGAWTSQEEGSQVVALSLGAKAGETVLDACAGRGNKTGLLARMVGAAGAVDAADLHPAKLERLVTELERIRVAPRATFAVDWVAGTGGATGPYDRILVDAPCSGTGTIRRRPELLLRRKAADLPALAELQRAILGRVAGLVRPGGRLVYAVCSVLREEAEDVVAGAEAMGLTPSPFDADIAMKLASGDATSFRLMPHEHETDGYFVASFVKRG
ncbi:MAG: Ribosomal small subunit methyltransferase [Myxococcaceae bacterium]|nr:Ribosomal small subunit methyltransferase [Myxococcaceae bacterium]MEA2746269.1 rRNA (cytosine967-C5)-methyltransferase [Myxococcales bacterium]